MPEAQNWLRSMRNRSAGGVEQSEDGAFNFGLHAGFLDLIGETDPSGVGGTDGLRVYGRVKSYRTVAKGSGHFTTVTLRGSVQAPEAVVAGDTLGLFSFRGHDGVNFGSAGHISAVAAANFTETNHAGKLIFSTVPPGSVVHAIGALLWSRGVFVIGSLTTEDATFEKGLLFGLAASVAPTTLTDRVAIGGLDISAGNRALAVWQESAPNAAADVASTHGLPVTINGTQYRILLTTVMA